MKKILCLTLAIIILSMGVFGIVSEAKFGSGAEVISKDVRMIKTGLLGQKLCFSDGDFKSAFVLSDFDSITVNKLPSSNEGTLLLEGRRVKEGQTIKRRNIAALSFVPLSAEITSASFTFTMNEGSGCECVCEMKFIDKINYAPKAPEDGEASLSVTTQSEISLFGRMKATDPEGDKLEYMIVSYPKNGSISITDNELGKYKYTPGTDFSGYDKFSYVARDEYGNYTEVITIDVKIVERMSDEVFCDMTERGEYNAALAMSAMGVMSGKRVGDDLYFMPEDSVSRAEFVAMAMKALGLLSDSSIDKSFFDDNDEIPTSLVGYVATAQRMGIIDGELISGKLIFEPNKPITKYEAAMIMAEIAGAESGSEDEVYLDGYSVPIFSRASIGAMVTMGIFEEADDKADYTATVTRAEAAEYLYRLINA